MLLYHVVSYPGLSEYLTFTFHSQQKCSWNILDELIIQQFALPLLQKQQVMITAPEIILANLVAFQSAKPAPKEFVCILHLNNCSTKSMK